VDRDRRFNRHAGTQQVRALVGTIDKDLYGNTLHDFHEVAGRVLRRQQSKIRPRAALEAVDVPLQRKFRESIEAHIILSDRGLEVEADACDLVLRHGMPNDPAVITRKVATTDRVLCASPSYLARRGTPLSPDDLTGHDCLRIARRHQLLDRWDFARDGNQYTVRVRGTLSSEDGAVLYQWALAGEGISSEASWDIVDDLAAGRLVRVLPDYQCPAIELYAAFAPGKPVPPRIRLFVDHLVQSFRRLPGSDTQADDNQR